MKRGESQSLEARMKIQAWNIRNNGKPVLCLETGRSYKTISAAERKLKVAPVMVSRICHRERSAVHGCHFHFLREEKCA